MKLFLYLHVFITVNGFILKKYTRMKNCIVNIISSFSNVSFGGGIAIFGVFLL